MGATLIMLFALVLLIGLITLLKWHPFIALVVVALCSGLASGMSPALILSSIQTGIGATLGSVVMILAFGFMLGHLMVVSGATGVIAQRLLDVFGTHRARWVLALTAFITGLAMFYNAGFMVLAPMVFSIARQTGQSLVPLSIAMAAPLSVTHGFLPPHPGATNIAKILNADLGKTLLYGIVVAVPAILAGGILFPRWLSRFQFETTPTMAIPETETPKSPPNFWISLFVALLPVALMAIRAVAEMTLPETDSLLVICKTIGDAGIAMLIAVMTAVVLLFRPWFIGGWKALHEASESLGVLAGLLMIIAGGGAFKEILTASKIADTVASSIAYWPVSPLILVWCMSTALRIAVGSATVAGMTAASIALPLIQQSGVSPELACLSIGAGSLMCSHVNDTGFWMYRQWFGVSMKDTFLSWSLMESIVGIMGLIMVLVVNCFI